MKARILAPENRKWWTLASLSVALFMIMLDNTIVNVALPSIQHDLGISRSELEWTVTAYAVTFAVLLLTGGKLADLLGRRKIFMFGLAIFTLSSLWCGLSGGATELIAARSIQGIGAALMMPATLSIITHTFEPRERGTAIGIWAGVSAMALAIGPLLGGLLTEHLSWNWIFYVNVPIGAIGLATTTLTVPESRDTSREQRLDLPGLLSSGIAMFALVYALIEANQYGWTSARIIGLFVVAAVGFVAFVLLELHQRLPMLEISLFRNGTFVGAISVALLVTLAMFGIFFFFPIFLQTVREPHWSPVQVGAALLPWTLMVVIFAPIAGRLSDRVGSRWLMAGGMTTVAASCAILSTVGLHSSFWHLLPGFVLGGVGMSFTMTPMSAAAMSAVPVDKSGVASGVLNTFRQIGAALGIAIFGAILASRATSAAAAGADPANAFMHGFTFGLQVSAVICLGAAATAVLLVRKHEHAGARRQADKPVEIAA